VRTADNDSDRIVYLENSDLYREIVEKGFLDAREEVWIATANLKDMRVKYKGKFVSITKVFSELVYRGVNIRLLHASGPSKPYMKSLRRSVLEKQQSFQRVLCPRVHFKTIIVDRSWLYLGSANITGAGLGNKSEQNRNFEIGLQIHDPVIVNNVINFFDFIWRGEMCLDCGRRASCPHPISLSKRNKK